MYFYEWLYSCTSVLYLYRDMADKRGHELLRDDTVLGKATLTIIIIIIIVILN